MTAGKIALCFCTIFILSCTPQVNVQKSSAPETRYDSKSAPDTGELVKATVGQRIYAEEKFLSQRAIRLDGNVNETFGLGAKVILKKESELVRSSVGGEPAYCSVNNAYIPPGATTPQRSTCFFDNNNDNRLDEFWVAGTLESTSRSMTPTPFSKGKQRLGEEGFLRELVFQGTSEDVIRIKYREFKNDLARPAFSQSLTYTASSLPSTIAFREFKMKVKDVGQSSIRYTVIQGF